MPITDPNLVRAYSISSTGNIPRGAEAEIMVSISTKDDTGIAYEFGIRWYELDNKFIPRVEMFEDSWSAYADMPDLFAWFADRSTRTPKAVAPSLREIITVLEALGFENHTRAR